ncbi:ATP-binding protein [Rhizobacter sp. J219]|uniref:hybrid sensor histidine kinase/response regulator n=1 Tax=Rhizobacter sp. J219 TaxID=2898430 RepID=UPI002151DB04|nr:ATP-binding protein [Rhizobacter sp. J219]MCR5883942.1 ATP-binding protein [Rhizobacter sp. J219]
MHPTRPARPLRHKLILLAAVGLLPVSLLGAWGIWNAIQTQRQNLERSTLELSRALASAVESEIDATLRSLAAMARAKPLAEGNIAAFYEVAQNEAAARPAWIAVVLTNGQGEPLFNTVEPYGSREPRVVDPSSLAKVIQTGQPVVGALTFGRRQSGAFAVRWPVVIDGKLAYVVTAAVKPEPILDVLQKQSVPPGWVIAVFDSAQNRVARTRQHQSQGPSPTLKALLSRPADSGSGLTRSLEGDDVYTGFTRLRDAGWTVAVGAPTAGPDHALATGLAWYVAGTLTTVLLCMALARRIADRITEDIHAVRDSAVQLGEGHPVAEVHSEIDEIDQMARALRQASQRLSETTESMRQALSQATAAAQAKDQFLAVLGHELRNPLAPMLTTLHLLNRKSDESTAREREIMGRQVAHMRRLVDDLLDVSRITRGKLEIRREPVNLFAVVERAVEAVQPALAAKRSKGLFVELPSAPLWVQGDETRLVQAVTNLLTNALRFGGEGTISLAVNVDELHKRASLCVEDEGEGMEAETLERVFEPFYQAPQTSERANGGLGLGLAIVRNIVQLHGGEVQAHSDGLQRGSRFTIELPTIAPPLPADIAPLRHAATGTGRVLVVDDNTDALDTAAEVLRHAGHQVQTAGHPRDALAAFASLQPEVVVLDIGLPEMDGYQLAQALRNASPDWRGRFIALTGYGQEADKARAAAAGFSVHLTKPADPSALLHSVDMLLPRPTRSA